MDLESAYHLRKNIYDNKELYFDLSKTICDINLDEYELINNKIIEGKEVIKNELINQSMNLNKKDALVDLENEIKSISIDMVKKIENLKFNLLDHDIVIAQDEIDSITYAWQCINESFSGELKNKMTVLNDKLKKSEIILAKLSSGFGILKNINVGIACPICINNHVNVFVSKCGHVFCNSCIEKSNYCYMCRTKIDKINKLYFS